MDSTDAADKNMQMEFFTTAPDPADTSDGCRELITAENLWQVITSRQGRIFYTAKKLPFTYMVKGGEMFTDRRERSITRSTFEKAYTKILDSDGGITGPKKLNMYGAPYVWAILKGIGAIGL